MYEHWPYVIMAIFVEKSRHIGNSVLGNLQLWTLRCHKVVEEQGFQNQKV